VDSLVAHLAPEAIGDINQLVDHFVLIHGISLIGLMVVEN